MMKLSQAMVTRASAAVRATMAVTPVTSSTRALATEARPEDYGYYPDPVEDATGLQKKLLLARLAGDDRYEAKVYKRGPGTEMMPNLVPVHLKNRLIGCVCEPDAQHIVWFWVRRGEKTRCECGHWFEAVDADPESL